MYLTKDIITEQILGAKIRSALGVNPPVRTLDDIFHVAFLKTVNFALSFSS